jgi:hypothetical protein
MERSHQAVATVARRLRRQDAVTKVRQQRAVLLAYVPQVCAARVVRARRTVERCRQAHDENAHGHNRRRRRGPGVDWIERERERDGVDRRGQHQQRFTGLEPTVPPCVSFRGQRMRLVTVDDVTERQAQMVDK